MTLGIRKLVVVGIVLGIMLMANALVISAWLNEAGLVEIAGKIRSEFLTGTAITILVALLILLVQPRVVTGAHVATTCSVCGETASPRASYCADCGSKL